MNSISVTDYSYYSVGHIEDRQMSESWRAHEKYVQSFSQKVSSEETT
jgi:hypothetical protein